MLEDAGTSACPSSEIRNSLDGLLSSAPGGGEAVIELGEAWELSGISWESAPSKVGDGSGAGGPTVDSLGGGDAPSERCDA